MQLKFLTCFQQLPNQNMYFTDFLECIAFKMNFYLTIYFVINKLKLKEMLFS